MKPYLLQREQWIPQPIEKVFAFFADASNLETITPSWLRFQILSQQPIELGLNSRILYRLHWHGVALRWLTEIQSWEPPTCFVDVQLRGPYRLWHHTHVFEPVEGGTLMRDVVRYALPFGIVGRLAHAWRVRSDLEAIFAYRASKIAEIFSSNRVPA